jgi:hypothetical protein
MFESNAYYTSSHIKHLDTEVSTKDRDYYAYMFVNLLKSYGDQKDLTIIRIINKNVKKYLGK